MKRYLRIYNQYIKYSTIKLMEFRADFFVTLIHLFVFGFMNIAFYRAILANVRTIAGWNYPQMIVLMGTFFLIDSLFFTFFLGNFARIDSLVRRAELDRVLTKPIDSQFVSTLQVVNYKEIPSFFMGVFVVCYGLAKLGFMPSALQIIAYILLCLTSLLIIYSLGVILSCISFYTEKSEDLHEVLISFLQFGKLPDVYRGFVKAVFMVAMPIVFASHVPAGIFFGKISPWFLVYYLLMALILFVFARKLWKISLKRYKSAGG